MHSFWAIKYVNRVQVKTLVALFSQSKQTKKSDFSYQMYIHDLNENAQWSIIITKIITETNMFHLTNAHLMSIQWHLHCFPIRLTKLSKIMQLFQCILLKRIMELALFPHRWRPTKMIIAEKWGERNYWNSVGIFPKLACTFSEQIRKWFGLFKTEIK